ncbi:HGGxSTG domain-containing protein [Mesorhizobium marinum]|uniref:HGGxSTG domain-containing protein n=1 Tax=Mesorhizobium marinum TaxID=3228790 RepID=UPI0034678944
MSGSHKQTCGAKTRRGTPCAAPVVQGMARCKLHGGLSTGPRTDAGRASIAAGQRLRWRTWRERLKKNDP